MSHSTQVFLLDNFDSFTYNLVDEMRCLGFELTVYRNNQQAGFLLEKMQACANPPVLMLSPGPGAPSEAGCMPALLKLVQGKFPVLGICLGHQAIVEHYGGKVGRAGDVMHGKASAIEHCQDRMFAGLPHPLPVARYHSLMASHVPAGLEILARYQHIPMAVYHARDKMLGMQFHPESILTSQGSRLLAQSIAFLGEQ
ncbi:aminodeoxychorismate/anthranilate synthase component II [Bowmanella dokdonensis]|uniref:anthranilate synthase n=1 Tax=Bowmanella dokdonensis TaxID=751969 RepID=A0A939ISX7_9ALTE|nr:aminodeoxychorismate/anthranilate synthase component II [Bowmanella dokdonensis]MBN7826891.1 aminodeoxychorismate/anthranilate synthase component II [Bowmanella dokdonensis]